MIAWNFGLAWTAFAVAIAVHVADEATHDFLALYNPNARNLRRRLHLPVPVFTLRSFIITLASAVCLLFALSPLAFHGAYWLRLVAVPLGILAGILNAFLHIGGSILYRRRLGGVLSSPLLLFTGSWLLWSACQEAPALF